MQKTYCYIPGSAWASAYKAKGKYRGMFEIQKSGDKTSSEEIGLDKMLGQIKKSLNFNISVFCLAFHFV